MKLLFILILLTATYVSAMVPADGADVADEALLINVQSQGHTVFYSCIQTPPTTAAQATYCAGIYSSYVVSLQALNAPLPMVHSIDPSPFSWSPYDICRFDTANLALFDLCPSIP